MASQKLEAVFVEGLAPSRGERHQKNLSKLEDKLSTLSCEDEELFDLANPLIDTEDDPEAREDAIVRVLLARPVSVLILGAADDLAHNLERIVPRAELIRVKFED